MLDARGLAAAIDGADFRGRAATVVGFGNMGREYVKALQLLGVEKIRVCARSRNGLGELQVTRGVETITSGFKDLACEPVVDELGIIAVPIESLGPALRRLVELGFRRVLVEKPVALTSTEVLALCADVERAGATITCALNRTAYPAFFEVLARVQAEGGASSCHYEFTELVRPDWPDRFSPQELARWGIANSIHVISMAHGLIGVPRQWHAQVGGRGAIAWHSGGSVLTGVGMTERDVPYTYSADWGSTGRWLIDVHTGASSYRLCPLETVQRRERALGPWEEVLAAPLSAEIKPGILEQVALALGWPGGPSLLWDLNACGQLVAYVEEVCGYAS